jgi:nucleotide-binding universal stress UspA family protein
LDIVLARIIEPRSPEGDPGTTEESVQVARLYLRQVAAVLASHGIKAKTVVRAGPVTPGLLAVASEEGSSLIAMSTHGRLTPEGQPFGSVGKELLETSPVPILAVPSHAPMAEMPLPQIRTMLVPVDKSGQAQDVAPDAVEFAISFGVDLAVLLEVLPPEPTGRGNAEERVDAEALLGHLSHLFERNGIPTVRLIKQQGDPVRGIVEAVREQKADVVAMSGPKADRRNDAVWAVTEGAIKLLEVPLFLT